MDYVRVATTANRTLSGLTPDVDGVALSNGWAVLVKDQSTAADNGVYIASTGAWVRDTTFDSVDEAIGRIIYVSGGDTNAGSNWQCTSFSPSCLFENLSKVPAGAAQSLADSDEALTSARRAVRSTLTDDRVDTVPDGTLPGERRTYERTDTSVFEMRLINGGGDTVAVLARPGKVELEWDGGAWRPIGHDVQDRTFYPEEFGTNVGNGDANADTAAIQAMFDAITAYPGAGTIRRECTRVHFRAPKYLINQTIKVNMPGGFNSLVIDGVSAFRAMRGTMLEWAGATAASKASAPQVEFIASSGTLRRSVGSWVTDGFAAGQQIMVQGAGFANNTGHWTVQSVSATDLVVDDAYQGLLDEGPVSNIRVLQWLPVLAFVGCYGIRMSRIEIDAQDKASHCCHSMIDPNLYPPDGAFSSGNRWDDCSFHSAFDHRDAAEFGVGRLHQPGAGSQCDTHDWYNCYFSRYNALATPTGVRGIRFYDSANTEGFTFINCAFSFNKVHVEGPVFSNFYHCLFESSFEWDVDVSTGVGLYSCQSEHRNTGTGSGLVRQNGRAAPTTIVQHTWQGILPADDVGIQSLGQLKVQGCFFNNLRATRNVLSVDASGDTLTCDLGHREVPLDGETEVELIVDQHGGATYPKGLQAHVRYWPINISGTTTQTFQLSLSKGGGPVPFTSAGSGAMLISSPFRIIMEDGSLGSGAASIEQCTFTGSVDWLPVINAIVNKDLQSPYWNRWLPGTLAKIRSQGNTGGWSGYNQELRDGHSRHEHALALQPYIAQETEWRGHGAPLSRAIACMSFRAGELDSQFPVIYLPSRSRLVQVLVEIVTPFAGTGPLTALTLDIYDAAGAAGDFFATPVNLMAASGTWFGLHETEVGATLAAHPRGYALQASMAAGMSVQTVFTYTGSSPSALTAGQANVYFLLDQFPSPTELA